MMWIAKQARWVKMMVRHHNPATPSISQKSSDGTVMPAFLFKSARLVQMNAIISALVLSLRDHWFACIISFAWCNWVPTGPRFGGLRLSLGLQRWIIHQKWKSNPLLPPEAVPWHLMNWWWWRWLLAIRIRSIIPGPAGSSFSSVRVYTSATATSELEREACQWMMRMDMLRLEAV